MEISGLRDLLQHADLLVTGEGSLDVQSLRGNGPIALAALARATGSSVVAVSGRCALTPEQLWQNGITAVYALSDLEPDSTLCMSEAPRILEAAATYIARDWLPTEDSGLRSN